MSTLKSAASTYGSFQGYGLAIGMIIISMCLCGFGASTIKNPDTKHTGTATATLANVTCDKSGGDKHCDVTANYTVATKPYSLSVRIPCCKNNGETIPVYYDPANPADAQSTAVLDGKSGGLMIGCGFLMFIIGCLVAYFMSQASNNTKALIGGASLLSSVMHHD